MNPATARRLTAAAIARRPKVVDGANGTLTLDWGVVTELRYVARNDLGSIVATFPATIPVAKVVQELTTMGIPAGTRLTIRKEEVDIDEEDGALIGAPDCPYNKELDG